MTRHDQSLLRVYALAFPYQLGWMGKKYAKAVEASIINHLLRKDFAQTSLHKVTKITVNACRDTRFHSVKPGIFARELDILRHYWLADKGVVRNCHAYFND